MTIFIRRVDINDKANVIPRHLLVSNVYTAETACEMTFVSSVASSEHGGRGETAGTYVVI